MHRIQKTAIMPYSVEKMFVLVNDVESYPSFLPWCRKAAILSSEGNQITAQLVLAKGALEKSFTTKNTLTPNSEMIMELVDGPFKHLKGDWRFQSMSDDSCQISLDLEFSFSSKLIAMMFGPVFQQAANMLVDAFVKRAAQIYGKKLSS